MGFILLNARLRGVRKDPLRQEVSDGFNAAFHVRLCGREGEGLVYRALQDGSSPWILVVGLPDAYRLTWLLQPTFDILSRAHCRSLHSCDRGLPATSFG
ncbi:unnamed protein product [Symbiodinium microadriaticum]|nr:unnamed protein product [Symbiodinium microadriaticum]CAE7894065.1 unnamed protein product [Symbiodinium sp. KB8]